MDPISPRSSSEPFSNVEENKAIQEPATSTWQKVKEWAFWFFCSPFIWLWNKVSSLWKKEGVKQISTTSVDGVGTCAENEGFSKDFVKFIDDLNKEDLTQLILSPKDLMKKIVYLCPEAAKESNEANHLVLKLFFITSIYAKQKYDIELTNTKNTAIQEIYFNANQFKGNIKTLEELVAVLQKLPKDIDCGTVQHSQFTRVVSNIKVRSNLTEFNTMAREIRQELAQPIIKSTLFSGFQLLSDKEVSGRVKEILQTMLTEYETAKGMANDAIVTFHSRLRNADTGLNDEERKEVMEAFIKSLASEDLNVLQGVKDKNYCIVEFDPKFRFFFDSILENAISYKERGELSLNFRESYLEINECFRWLVPLPRVQENNSSNEELEKIYSESEEGNDAGEQLKKVNKQLDALIKASSQAQNNAAQELKQFLNWILEEEFEEPEKFKQSLLKENGLGINRPHAIKAFMQYLAFGDREKLQELYNQGINIFPAQGSMYRDEYLIWQEILFYAKESSSASNHDIEAAFEGFKTSNQKFQSRINSFFFHCL